MADPGRTESSPWIGLPATFDRRLRMGPFPSVRDALKFATYAAVGAIPAALVARLREADGPEAQMPPRFRHKPDLWGHM